MLQIRMLVQLQKVPSKAILARNHLRLQKRHANLENNLSGDQKP